MLLYCTASSKVAGYYSWCVHLEIQMAYPWKKKLSLAWSLSAEFSRSWATRGETELLQWVQLALCLDKSKWCQISQEYWGKRLFTTWLTNTDLVFYLVCDYLHIFEILSLSLPTPLPPPVLPILQSPFWSHRTHLQRLKKKKCASHKPPPSLLI